MNEIKVFENQKYGKVRTVLKDGEPWFVGKDVAEILGYSNPSEALSNHVEPEDKLNSKTLSSFELDDKMASSLGQRGGWLINESGLYSLVIRSNLPAARQFKRWITHEVIPSIRKSGAYLTPKAAWEMISSPDAIIKMCQNWQEDRLRLEEANAKIEQDAPKVRFAESVEGSDTNILIGTLAKLLKQNGIDIGEKRLFQRLREDGYLCRMGERNNVPTQRAMDMKLFEVTERTFCAPDGSTFIRPTTKVTGKGQVYFINRYGKVQ